MAQQGLILDEVAALVDGAIIVPTTTKTLDPVSPKTLAVAHQAVESGRSFGKTVLPGIKKQ